MAPAQDAAHIALLSASLPVLRVWLVVLGKILNASITYLEEGEQLMKDYKALELQMLRMCPRSADITERTAKALQKALGISMPISFAVRATCLTLGQIEEERLGNCAIYTTTRKGIERLKEAKD